MEVYEELSYKISKDFNILINYGYEGANEIFFELKLGLNKISNETEIELHEFHSIQYGLCYILKPNFKLKPNDSKHFIINYTKTLDTKDIPESMTLYLSSDDTYQGILYGSWSTLVEPLAFDLVKSGKVSVISFEEEQWKYYRYYRVL